MAGLTTGMILLIIGAVLLVTRAGAHDCHGAKPLTGKERELKGQDLGRVPVEVGKQLTQRKRIRPKRAPHGSKGISRQRGEQMKKEEGSSYRAGSGDGGTLRLREQKGGLNGEGILSKVRSRKTCGILPAHSRMRRLRKRCRIRQHRM